MKAYLDTCKSCWWQEGGKCYEANELRGEAKEKCEKYRGKRAFLEKFIPGDKLIITSEERGLKQQPTKGLAATEPSGSSVPNALQ